jgi:hypothetical protein
MTDRTCSVPDCERPRFKRDLCSMHYDRHRLTGEVGQAGPLIANASMTVAERLSKIGWDEVVRVPALGPCHEWRGARHPQGYGQMSIKGRTTPAHRASLEASGVSIHAGMVACHRCDNPPCINPAHLYPGTYSQNTNDFYSRSGFQRPRGAAHPMAKLTSDEVEHIRNTYADGAMLQRELAKLYGVSLNTIWRVIHHKTWV